MNDIEVKPSPIQGLGIFARRQFRAGDRLSRVNVVREITAEAPIREDLGGRIDHCDYPDGKVLLLGFPDRQINHCCDPNTYQKFEAEASYLVARRDISAGEEITFDYNINITNGTAWPCNCGANRCRKVVAGDFFHLPVEWQREYRPLLAEWFVRRNRDRVEALDRSRIGGHSLDSPGVRTYLSAMFCGGGPDTISYRAKVGVRSKLLTPG